MRFAGDGIAFEVDQQEWVVAQKWDDTTAYRRGIGMLGDSSAVDYVAVRKDELYFIESKVYMGPAGDPSHDAIVHKRPQLSELPDKVGRKVRDTIAGVVAAYRSAAVGDEEWPWLDKCVRALLERSKPVHVVVWIVEPGSRPGEPESKQKARKTERNDRIRKALVWLTRRVSVVNPVRGPCPTGIKVTRPTRP